MRFIFILLFSFFCLPGQAQLNDYQQKRLERNEDCIFSKNIRSVVVCKSDIKYSAPIIMLNSGDAIHGEFDDLDGDVKSYRFSVTHCDANWQPSDIWQNDYISGFTESNIHTYAQSFNTIQLYTHYSFTFPNEEMAVKLSGNYLLKVFYVGYSGKEEIAFTRRILVVEPKVTIQGQISRASTVDDFETKQEINFTVSTPGTVLFNPQQDVKVAILQNNRWDNALTTLKPYMVRNNALDYSYHDRSNQFWGGNEFRRFSTISTKYATDKVHRIVLTDSGYVFNLWETKPRRTYFSETDRNGNFELRTEDRNDVDTEGEYAWVTFLMSNPTRADGQVYVRGQFNGWECTPENQMQYIYSQRSYEATLYLKQGFYNYIYTLIPKGSTTADDISFEGSFQETSNTYTILVYYRERGSRYDQLIGSGIFDSSKRY